MTNFCFLTYFSYTYKQYKLGLSKSWNFFETFLDMMNTQLLVNLKTSQIRYSEFFTLIDFRTHQKTSMYANIFLKFSEKFIKN